MIALLARCGLLAAACAALRVASAADRRHAESDARPSRRTRRHHAHCRPLRTATAEIASRAASAPSASGPGWSPALPRPASLRLEALAPFGAPALVLASDGATTTLLFPRETQVLRDAPVADVLDAITGLALDAAELRRLLFGCVAGDGGARPRASAGGWQVVEAGETRAFLQRRRRRRSRLSRLAGGLRRP